MRSGISPVDVREARELTADGHFFRFWMPYVFQRVSISGTRWAYLPLNRIYKPLGIISRTRVDYNEFTETHAVKFTRDPQGFYDVWWNIDDSDGGRLWLYADDPMSRKDYFERLERLMSRSIRVIGAG
jgi:hypothetical protein